MPNFWEVDTSNRVLVWGGKPMNRAWSPFSLVEKCQARDFMAQAISWSHCVLGGISVQTQKDRTWYKVVHASREPNHSLDARINIVSGQRLNEYCVEKFDCWIFETRPDINWTCKQEVHGSRIGSSRMIRSCKKKVFTAGFGLDY